MTGKDGAPRTEPTRAPQTVFLERQSYRRRRLIDVARLMPLLGALLLLVPLLWSGAGQIPGAEGPAAPMPMSGAITYVFSVWAALIAGAALFGAGARRWGADDRQSEPGRD